MSLWHFDKRPEKPQTWAAYFAEALRMYPKNPWRCTNCHGSGRVVADWEQPDPVEGHKMSERVSCKVCHGTGNIGEAEHKKLWRKKREQQASNVQDWLDRRDARDYIKRHVPADIRRCLGLT